MLPEIRIKKPTVRFSNPLIGEIYSNSVVFKQVQKISEECDLQPAPKKNKSKNFRKTKKQHQVNPFGATIDTHMLNSQIDITNRFSDKAYNSRRGKRKSQQEKKQWQDIEVIWLDLNGSLSQQILHINLSEYFKIIANKKLKGKIDKEFIDTSEKLINKYIKAPVHNIVLESYPNSLFMLESKDEFLRKIKKLQNSQLIEQIIAATKYYLIPLPKISQSSLNDIILYIRKLLKQQYLKIQNPECAKLRQQTQKYGLISAQGQIINQLHQISFSTNKIYFANMKSIKNGLYKKLIEEYEDNISMKICLNNKLLFKNGLKADFRKLVAKGKYDQIQQYDPDFAKHLYDRRVKAENLLRFHRNSTKFSHNHITNSYIYNTHHASNHSSLQRTIKNSSTIQKTKKVNNKSKFFSNASEIRQSPRLQNQSGIKNISTIDQISRTQPKPRRKQLSLSMKHSLKFQTKIKTSQIPQEQHSNPKNLIQISLTQLKSRLCPKQINKIIETFRKQSIVPQDPTIFIIQQQEESILSFLESYLFVNQSQYISYQQFDTILQTALINTLDQETIEITAKQKQVFVQILWTWLQSNSFVTDQEDNELDDSFLEKKGNLIRHKFKGMYQKHYRFYQMLVSLIFGLYQQTIIDMAYEVLLND